MDRWRDKWCGRRGPFKDRGEGKKGWGGIEGLL